MPIFTEQNGYKILEWDEPLAGKKAAVVSDLHIGHAGSFFELPWARLKQGIRDRQFDFILLNGDVADGEAYFAAESQNVLSGKIYHHLEELLQQEPPVPLIINRGNHDLSANHQSMLGELAAAYPGRVFLCDAAVMQDAVFIHGDFTSHDPCTQDEIMDRLRDPERTRMVRNDDDTDDHDNTLRNVSSRLREVFETGYESFKHIFVGHFHPRLPFTGKQVSGEEGKIYHMTGCAKEEKTCTILQVHFGEREVSVTPYSEDRDPSSIVVSKGGEHELWKHIAASPAR